MNAGGGDEGGSAFAAFDRFVAGDSDGEGATANGRTAGATAIANGQMDGAGSRKCIAQSISHKCLLQVA